MITKYLANNLAQWFSLDIAFNDLVRCIANAGSSDVRTRYKADDQFYKHFEDLSVSQLTTQNYMYPYVGFDFGDYNPSVRGDCAVSINITFLIATRKCSLESCSTDNCSIEVLDPRTKIEEIICSLIDGFRHTSIDPGTGEIQILSLFEELRCTQQNIYDCDTQQDVLQDWPYNVWADLSRDPVVSQMRTRDDGIVEQNLTVPLRVFALAEDCESCVGQCTMC